MKILAFIIDFGAAKAIRKSSELSAQEPEPLAHAPPEPFELVAEAFRCSSAELEVSPGCVYPEFRRLRRVLTLHKSPPGAVPGPLHSPKPRTAEKRFPTLRVLRDHADSSTKHPCHGGIYSGVSVAPGTENRIRWSEKKAD